jgi:antitoxin VapB
LNNGKDSKTKIVMLNGRKTSRWEARSSWKRSQAVRLPKAFRFKGNEVKISKKGDMVILEPLGRSRWPEGFWDAFPMDHDFKIPEALPSKNFSLD